MPQDQIDTGSWPPGHRSEDVSAHFKPTLRDRTFHALRQVIDAKSMSLEQIAEESGVGFHWLRVFSSNRIADPGVNSIERLYCYLTGRTL